jgi:hypothetical protein
MDVRREAAPLMAAERSPEDRLAALSSTTVDPVDAEPAAGGDHGRGRAAGGDQDHLTVEAVPSLLGRGSMLRGADALNATARAAQAWLHPADAERAGVGDGDRVVLSAGDGRIELPARITEQVAEGCVRVPRNSLDTPLGVLVDPEAGGDAPLRVSVGAADRSPPTGSPRSPSPAGAEA